MSLQNPDNIVTEERLAEFYQQILPYMGGMPDVLANKFKKSDIYSETEQMVGVWKDGKPIYQKTIEVTPTVRGISRFDLTELSIETPVSIRALSVTPSGTIQTLDGITPSSITYSVAISLMTDEIYLNIGEKAVIPTKVIATIQYTKTTDSAVEIGDDTDYSTTEKIVGTWIDGKPIWQKTIDCGALPNSTTKEVDHNISNLDDIINYYGVSRNPTDGNRLILPYLSVGNLSNGVALTVNDTKIRIGTGSSRSAYTSTYVTIQYTKTSS